MVSPTGGIAGCRAIMNEGQGAWESSRLAGIHPVVINHERKSGVQEIMRVSGEVRSWRWGSAANYYPLRRQARRRPGLEPGVVDQIGLLCSHSGHNGWNWTRPMYFGRVDQFFRGDWQQFSSEEPPLMYWFPFPCCISKILFMDAGYQTPSTRTEGCFCIIIPASEVQTR